MWSECNRLLVLCYQHVQRVKCCVATCIKWNVGVYIEVIVLKNSLLVLLFEILYGLMLSDFLNMVHNITFKNAKKNLMSPLTKKSDQVFIFYLFYL